MTRHIRCPASKEGFDASAVERGPFAGTPVVMLVHDLNIRIIHAATGEIIRTLTLNSNKQYQPTGAKRGGPKRPYGPRKQKQPEP